MHERFPDSTHIKVPEVQLKHHGVLYRFNNPAGVPYSAIYVKLFEAFSCEREDEPNMIKAWNEANEYETLYDELEG